MPQLSLYLDASTMESLRCASDREGVSLSKYAGRLIRDHSASAWPIGFWDTYGALQDDSFVVSPELDYSLDAPRKNFEG